MPTYVTRHCEFCEKLFARKLQRLKIRNGHGRFCSLKCYGASVRSIPLIERFFAYVGSKQSSGCILWTGTTDAKGGYGVLGYDGRQLKAHRVAYDLFVGGLSPDLLVCHSCDNPPCINPVHLFQGTELDNAEDMVSKGRSHGGIDHWSAKLTEEQVREIKTELSSPNRNRRTRRALARRFSVTPAVIYQIDWGWIWKSV